MPQLAVEVAPNKSWVLQNPVMTASGTFGYGMEFLELYDIQRLGAIVCKGTTIKPKEGNPQPRLMEVPGGVLNYIGLHNIGVERLIAEMAPVWAGWRVPVVVNIAGEDIWEFGELARRLEGVPGVSALEVNISCPNLARGGDEFGSSPQATYEAVSAAREAISLPLLVKLSPNAADIRAVARAAVRAGADALTLTNTLRGMALDAYTGRFFRGGLSGAALKPVALRMVYEVAEDAGVPVIGCGGIAAARDALDYLLAGATAVQVGTANLVNPRAALEVLEGIEDYMREKGIEDIQQLIGVGRG